ncbi:hypothetical protein D3C80_2170520 [compost metagenome]
MLETLGSEPSLFFKLPQRLGKLLLSSTAAFGRKFNELMNLVFKCEIKPRHRQAFNMLRLDMLNNGTVST